MLIDISSVALAALLGAPTYASAATNDLSEQSPTDQQAADAGAATNSDSAQDNMGETEPSGTEIVVTGRAAKLYRVEETASGKLPTEPLASSQSITVITNELIEDQGARDAQDLYRNISGVSFFSYAGVTARGFRQQENFYDGLRGDPYIGFSVPQLFNVERVEFLKGPAGMLYGQTAPGGLFNYVSKTPSRILSGNVGAVIGNFDRYGGQAEVSGPIDDVLALRGGVFFEERDTARTFARNKTLIADAAATADLGPAKFTIQGLRVEQDLPGNRLRGVPVDNAGNFVTSPRWNHNEPSDFLSLRSNSVQGRGEIELVPGLKIDGIVRYIDATERQKYHEPTVTFTPANGNVPNDRVARQYRDQIRINDILSYATNLTWSTTLSDTIGNRFLAGYDSSKAVLAFDNRLLNGSTTDVAGRPCYLSLSNPVYGRCDPATYALPAYTRTFTDTLRSGVYALNELTIGRLVAIAGIRRDSFEDRNRNAALAVTSRFEDNAETYRGGLVWRARDDLSLFAQYATSFEPQSAGAQDPRAGGPFEPTTGDIYEAGVKTALMNGRIQSAIAVYQIKRQNLLQSTGTDPEGDGITNNVMFGEVRSRGVDVDLAADITGDWVLTANYAYNDTIITKDNGRTPITNAVGRRFTNAPQHKFGFWSRYQFRQLGLAVALGGDYVSSRVSFDNQRVQPYFVLDGSLTYTRGPWELRVRADNILDKEYAASGFSRSSGHFPGEPRTVFAEARYNF